MKTWGIISLHIFLLKRNKGGNFHYYSPVCNKKFLTPKNFQEYSIKQYLNYDFIMHFQMSIETFHDLLNEIGKIILQNKIYRCGYHLILLEKSLVMLLWYLTKGDTMLSTAGRFNIAI